MKRNRWIENRDGKQVTRDYVREGIGERLDRRKSLDAEGLEGVAVLAGRLLLRHRTVAALRHLHAAVQGDQTRVRIKRQEEVDYRQSSGYERRPLHDFKSYH